MRLALSTEAAPDLALADLVAACVRRGLAALELVEGHAHGVSPTLPAEALERVRRRLPADGPRIAAFRAGSIERATSPLAAALSAALAVPVVAPAGDEGDDDSLLEAAGRYAAAGGTLLVAHGTDAGRAERLRRVVEAAPEGALGLAWDVDPDDDGLAAASAAVLEAAGPHLRHVRLRGGGPEAAGQEGRGIGPLMARLTLAGYDGTLALAPSTSRYRYAWSAWLGRRGGWGCGSKSAGPSPVRLGIND
ncbi:MAG TPA: hypothetical protein VF212_04135 [Longimicrobiales bacterium]